MLPVSLNVALPRYRLGFSLLFCLFTLPVLAPYYANKGVGAADFFTIEALFRIAYFVFSFFTGLISDRWNRRGCLLLGTALWWVGGFTIFAGHGFWMVALGEIILAFGMAFFVSSGRAYLYDLLLSLDRAQEHPKELARQRGLENTVRMLATAAGGFLFVVWSEIPQLAVLVTTAVAGFILWRLPEPPRHRNTDKIAHLGDMLAVFHRIITRHPGLIQLMLYGSALVSLTVIVFWGMQPVMRAINFPIQYMGLALAGAAGLTAFFSAHGHKIVSRIRIERLILILLPIGFVEIAVVSLFQHPLALLVFVLNSFLFSMVTVGFEDLVQRQVSSDIRATTLSLGLMLDMLFSSAALFAMGQVAHAAPLSWAFILVGGAFIMLGGWLLFSLLKVFPALKRDY